MANEEHLEILRQGVDTWNQWRKENPTVTPILFKADLIGAERSGADLREAFLVGAKLNRAEFRETDFSRANLSGADLSEADLREADLREADLLVADLSGADLSGVNLLGADLSGANLSGADLSKSRIALATFGDIDLGIAVGLDSVKHTSPSTIGIDTIYKSKGKIPESFLRGAGVPDTLIAQIPALVGALQPIEFHSCFISYSHKNKDFAKRLHSRMRGEHLRVWFAPEDIRAGRKVHEQIESAIRHYDKLLLVLSEDSMDSQWVETEIYHARQREIKEKRRVLFPIRLVDFETIRDWTCFNADTGRDMAREIREYYLPDFSDWKDHDAFEETFDRLLRDLKAEDLETP